MIHSSNLVLPPDALVLDGKVRVVRHLSKGGMGDVYEAVQVATGQRVALKVLRQELARQRAMSERFRREAKMLASVDHPAVVRIIEFGESNGDLCLVMEFVEGETLLSALQAGPMPPSRAIPILIQLAEGLAAIHDEGIIHRDLKPENIVITRGSKGEQARLLDFGIARLAEPDEKNAVSAIGTVVGTPEFISPEQAVGGKLDGRSDLYCLAVLAYRMLTWKLPFPGPSPRQFMIQHVSTPPTPIDIADPALVAYPKLCALIMRCLEKSPDKRPKDARVMISELKRLPLTPKGRSRESPIASPNPTPAPSSGTAAFGTGPVASPDPQAEVTERNDLRRFPKRLVAGAGVLLVVVAAVAGVLFVRRAPALPAPAELGRLMGDYASGNPAAASQLSSAPQEPLRAQLAAMAKGPASKQQWGALRYLDETKQAEGLNLVSLYSAALESPDCAIREASARRLGELGDRAAIGALSKVKKGCARDEAAAALRLLRQKSNR